MIETFRQDLRYALRGLARSPTFTTAAVACFALGIGANAVMFGIVDRLFLRAPAHVLDPKHVMRVYTVLTTADHGDIVTSARSYPQYLALRGSAPAFTDVAAYWATDVAVGQALGARRVKAAIATHTVFPLLGVRAAVGRLFEDSDDQPASPPVAVLAHGYWSRQFAADSGLLGRTLRIGGGYYTVIGVLPEGFTGVDLDAVDVWLPISTAGRDIFAPDALSSPYDAWLSILLRLPSGVSVHVAEAQATAALLGATPPAFKSERPVRALLGPIQAARGPRPDRDAEVAALVGGVSLIVLLIACANVANLLFARALRRRREVAIRIAIGAGRGRLVRQLLVECVLLAVIGSAGALLIVVWGAPTLQAYLLPSGLAGEPLRDPRVLLFTAVAAVATGLLSGLVPALQTSRSNLSGELAAGERAGGSGRSRWRSGLLVAQVALSLTLLAGAGLFVRSLRNVEGVDIGLDPAGLIAVSLDFHGMGYKGPEALALYQRALERVRTLPTVREASLSLGSPFGWSFGASMSLPGRGLLRNLNSYYSAVSPAFFATLRVAIVRGRGFTEGDRAGTPKVAIVSQALARAVWVGIDPLGQCFRNGDDSSCTTVVGVAANVPQFSIIEDSPLMFYIPLAQNGANAPPSSLFVRTAGLVTDAVPILRRAIVALAPELPFVEVTPLRERIDPQLKPWRLGTTMFGIYGGLALALTALGLYGVLAYSVTQRTREIGIRIALGARRRVVVRLVVQEALTMTAVGLAIGAAASLAGSGVVASQLYGVSARDPLVLLLAACTLVAVSVVAAYLPARRATRVDPMIALRAE